MIVIRKKENANNAEDKTKQNCHVCTSVGGTSKVSWYRVLIWSQDVCVSQLLEPFLNSCTECSENFKLEEKGDSGHGDLVGERRGHPMEGGIWAVVLCQWSSFS